ncbi:MAG: hypothetical protein MPJ50_16615 [Pirellulales bacterium]|nr:hypothetical protein [Pirellulales bacterium]
MEFIELTGRQLLEMADGETLSPDELKSAGVQADSVVRVNRQGDIELRKTAGWDVIGGMIGEFEARVKQATNLDWA